jgi:hypothetical protein
MSEKSTVRTARIFGLALTLAFVAAYPAQAFDPDSIRVEMMKVWDKPESRLVIDPVVVAGSHAIAGWSQGDMGGRALLRKKGNVWEIILCAGDDLNQTDLLEKAGMTDANARQLAAALAKSEASLSHERLALFSKFEGLVMMNSHSGAHGHSPNERKP